MRITRLEIDRATREHIAAKHGIRPEEVERAYYDSYRYISVAKQKRMRILGKDEDTGKNLALFGIVARGAFKLITCRPMVKNELAVYRESRKKRGG